MQQVTQKYICGQWMDKNVDNVLEVELSTN